jgi:hypothetical protein
MRRAASSKNTAVLKDIVLGAFGLKVCIAYPSFILKYISSRIRKYSQKLRSKLVLAKSKLKSS